VEAPDRSAVTQAAHALDQTLRRKGAEEGESRSDGMRISFVLPLGITFSVDEARAEVVVLQVWFIH